MKAGTPTLRSFNDCFPHRPPSTLSIPFRFPSVLPPSSSTTHHWQITFADFLVAIARDNGNGPADGAAKGTPRKRAPAAKKTPKKIMKNDSDDDDEPGSSFDNTPSKKKGNLNKVQTGRIVKASPRSARAAAPAPGTFAELSDDDDEIVKEDSMNDGSDEYEVHGNGHRNGHANGNGYVDDDMNGYDYDDQFIDAQEEA